MTRHPAPFVRTTREIEEALLRSQPVVALETTLVAHGFPPPIGVETALAAEDAVREAGAVPATIGLMDGVIGVGLDREELERLAEHEPRKVGPNNLASTLVDGDLGATTVAGTMAVARLCGIRHLSTGGIGGVHRGAEHTFDVSADLGELARSRICVVCSGPKGLLDVAKTLEVLESLGVPVVGFGTNTLPCFYARESPFELVARVDDADKAARFCETHWELGRTSSVLIANPPPEGSAISAHEAEALIEEAIAAAEATGIRGPRVTPWVLARIHEQSGGRTQTVNRDLIIENARLAGAIAAAAAIEAARG